MIFPLRILKRKALALTPEILYGLRALNLNKKEYQQIIFCAMRSMKYFYHSLGFGR